MPKYILIMRGTDESNAAMMANVDEMMAATRRVHRVDGPGRRLPRGGRAGPSGPGRGRHFGGKAPVVTDGPYGQTKELFGGHFRLDVASNRRRSSGPSGCRRPPDPRSRSAGVPGSDEVPHDHG